MSLRMNNSRRWVLKGLPHLPEFASTVKTEAKMISWGRRRRPFWNKPEAVCSSQQGLLSVRETNSLEPDQQGFYQRPNQPREGKYLTQPRYKIDNYRTVKCFYFPHALPTNSDAPNKTAKALSLFSGDPKNNRGDEIKTQRLQPLKPQLPHMVNVARILKPDSKSGRICN